MDLRCLPTKKKRKTFAWRQGVFKVCKGENVVLTFTPVFNELFVKRTWNRISKPLTLAFSVAFLNRRDQLNSTNQIGLFTSLCI